MKFYKETNFQETPIGKIPKDWEVMRATDVAEYINGYPFSPKDWKTSGIPIIRIQNLNDPNAEFNFFDGEIDEIYKVKNGDLLLSWSASIGVYIWKRGDAVLNQHIFKVIPKPKVNKLFLYYALFLAIEQLKRRVHGSTMKHFRRGELETTFLPFPPLGEQQKITEILSIVDEAIQKTDEITAKGERLKKALMNELLTGRIRVREENGRLSFYRETELQETEIGKIPRNWRIEKLGSIVVKAKMGGTPKRSVREYWDGDIPFAKIEDITSSHKYLFKTSTTITRLGLENSNAWVVPRDSLLITIYGTLGAVAVNKIELATNQAIVGIVPKKEIVDVEFLHYWYSFFQPNWNKYVKKSTQPNLTLEIIVNSIIPLPPLNEQKGIVRILSLIDRTVELYHRERERLERLKRGLMDLLLTGKVRVIDGDVGS